MDYSLFIKEVQTRGNLDSREEAAKAVEATLQTLGERLFGGEAKDLAAQLPRNLSRFLLGQENKGDFHKEEFVQRVSRREGTDPAMAEAHARTVIGVLCDAVSSGEIDDVLSQLPHDYGDLFAERRGKTLH